MYFIFTYFLSVFCTYGLAQTITFNGNPVAPAPTAPPSGTTLPAGCRCVAPGTCVVTTPNTGIDIRIVNPGPVYPNSTCTAAGQILCCGESTSLIDGCGVRKITNPRDQPAGTAKYGAYPWQAAILNLTNEYIGSGVLLSPLYVLTAAHKVSPYPNGNYKVRLGEWNGQENVETYPYLEFTPIQVVIHPNFVPSNLQNDVALIKLNKVVPIAPNPNINCAPMATALPAAGSRCVVSGWGKTSFDATGKYQYIQKEVDVPIVDQATCESRLRATRLGVNFILNRASFMCAGGETGKDACTGDGGSPLVCQLSTGQFSIVGLVSWGIGCAATSIPGVYVNVPSFRPWINQQMGVTG